jgi:DNA helicase HerA-like ATPase
MQDPQEKADGRMEAEAYLEPPQLVSQTDYTSEPSLPPPSDMRQIGTVVHWEGTPNFLDVTALLEPGEEVRPGQFVGVWHGRRARNILTVVQVGNSREVNPNEVPELAAARERLGLRGGYADEAVSTRIFRMLEGPTVEEVEIQVEGGSSKVVSSRAPELLVRASDPVVFLPSEFVGQVIGSLPSKDAGLDVGETYGSQHAQVTLPCQVFQMHTLISGNPGKGKSYLSGVLLEEAMKWKVPALALDIHGEFIGEAAALGGLVLTLPDPRFGLSLGLITPPELVDIAPNVQEGTIYAELIELAHDHLRGAAKGGPITFDQLCAEITRLGDQTKVAQPSIRTAISRVRALQRDPIIGGDFDFIEAMKKHGVVVLDCRFLSLRQTRLIAAAAARELQRVGREMARRAEGGDGQQRFPRLKEGVTMGELEGEAGAWFALLLVDEAHLVAPDDEHVVSSQVLFELARMGRHVRTGLVLSSQSPGDLNQSVLKRLQTRFIFALEQDQLRRIQGVTADLDERLLAGLPKLPRGVCAVSGSSELVRHGFLLDVRERQTPVGGKTPDVFASRKKRPLPKVGGGNVSGQTTE